MMNRMSSTDRMEKSRNNDSNNSNEQPTTTTTTTTTTNEEETRQKEQQQKQSLHLIFTVTAGRSGTTLLTRLLELIPVVVAKHEPKPSFVNVMRKVQNNATTADAAAQTTQTQRHHHHHRHRHRHRRDDSNKSSKSESDKSESESDTTDESIAITFLKEKKIPLILQQTNAAAQQQQQKQQQQQTISNTNSNETTAATAASLPTQLSSTTAMSSRITHYVETSHLFCKGFIEPMKNILLESSKTSTNSSSLSSSSCGDGGNHRHHHHHHHHHSSCCCYGYKLQKTFSLIILRRHPSLIAYSLLQRNAIPGRSRWGKKYLLHPNDWNVLGNNGNDDNGNNDNDRRRLRWISILSSWSDYQLCYWYALEIERRQIQYTKMACDGGWKCYTITIDELTNFDKFCNMCISLGIELPIGSSGSSLVQVIEGGQEESSFRDQFEKIAKQKHNLNNPTTCNDKHCENNDNDVEQHEKRRKKSASASASASTSRLLMIKQQFEKEEKKIWEWIRINSPPDMVSDLADYQLPSPL
jgi:hypothetical protein